MKLSKKLLIPLVIFSVICGFILYAFILNPPKFSVKIKELKVVSVQDSYLHVKVLMNVINNWIFSVSVKSGQGTIFLNGIELGFFRIPSTTLHVGENKVTADLFLRNNTIIDILSENIIRAHVKIDTAFGTFEIENITQIHFKENRRLFRIIDAFSLPKGRFLLVLQLNFTSLYLLNLNYTLSFIGVYNETILFYANGHFNISWETFPLVVQIPSNESLNTILHVFEEMKPIHMVGNVTLSYENWLSMLRFEFRTIFPKFTPSFNITVTEVNYDPLQNEFYIYARLYVPNNFSIEANISRIIIKVYTDDIFVGKGISYNQSILPKTVNAINITIIISGENASEVIKHKGRIHIIGRIVLKIYDTTFVIRIEKYYQIHL